MNVVIITRPSPHGEALCHAIEQIGCSAFHFPTLLIEPLPYAPPVLEDYDHIIFTSPNAVIHSQAWLRLQAPKQVIAMGQGTASALIHYGICIHAMPKDRCDSENLLALETMQSVAGKKILIVKGQGGRTLLADSLRERGAKVEYARVYKRSLPPTPPAALENLLATHTVLVIVSTSLEGLHNLIALSAPCTTPQLLEQRLMVSSPRIAEKAQVLGFTRPVILTKNAHNETLVKAIRHLLEDNHHVR